MHQLIHISSMCILRKSSLHATFKFIKLFSTFKLRDLLRKKRAYTYIWFVNITFTKFI